MKRLKARDTMTSWLEQLSAEIEHPTPARREGARAALRCLSQVVRLRAAADRTSRPDAWVRVFDADNAPVELPTEDKPLEERDLNRETMEVMRAIKRSIIEGEQARLVIGDAGRPARVRN